MRLSSSTIYSCYKLQVSSRYEQVTNVSLALHTLAQSMGITVMALSQLARAGKDSGSPGMASLRESGQN